MFKQMLTNLAKPFIFVCGMMQLECIREWTNC